MSLIGSGFLTIFSFVFLISIVVVIHELGHYWAGRVCGVHAEAFSMGFGPTLVSWRDKQGTVWRIAAFPLGGYVKFLGDAGAASEPDEAKLAEIRERMGADAEKCYHFKPIWQRAFITAAGPIANFILAVTIFASLALSHLSLAASQKNRRPRKPVSRWATGSRRSTPSRSTGFATLPAK